MHAPGGEGWPVLDFGRHGVFHVGSLDPGAAGREGPSYEGPGLSVSVDPAGWAAHYPVLEGQPWWRLWRRGGWLLDEERLSAHQRQTLLRWAERMDWVAPDAASGHAATDRLLERMGWGDWAGERLAWGRPGAALAFSEDVLGVDGVWWPDSPDAPQLARGVIFAGRVARWERLEVRSRNFPRREMGNVRRGVAWPLRLVPVS